MVLSIQAELSVQNLGDNQGVRRLGSRGNMDVFLMLFRPQYSMTTRSRPTPAPPWGGAPYLNASMYVCTVSTKTPQAPARSATRAQRKRLAVTWAKGVHMCRAVTVRPARRDPLPSDKRDDHSACAPFPRSTAAQTLRRGEGGFPIEKSVGKSGEQITLVDRDHLWAALLKNAKTCQGCVWF